MNRSSQGKTTKSIDIKSSKALRNRKKTKFANQVRQSKRRSKIQSKKIGFRAENGGRFINE